MTYLGLYLCEMHTVHLSECSFDLSRLLREGLSLPDLSSQSLDAAWSIFRGTNIPTHENTCHHCHATEQVKMTSWHQVFQQHGVSLCELSGGTCV